jgi:phosphoheptose isomerase
MEKLILDLIDTSLRKKKSLRTVETVEQISHAADKLITTARNGGKILVCGNGGSAADSAHFVAELMNRFTKRREFPIAAVDLSAMNSTITAIANDYSYDQIFAKQIKGLGGVGDTLVSISTSGNSQNVKEAVKAALAYQLNVIFLTGKDTPSWISDDVGIINAPSSTTATIQECHIMIIHILCALIDEHLVGEV